VEAQEAKEIPQPSEGELGAGSGPETVEGVKEVKPPGNHGEATTDLPSLNPSLQLLLTRLRLKRPLNPPLQRSSPSQKPWLQLVLLWLLLPSLQR
jgi:hypothetical protein